MIRVNLHNKERVAAWCRGKKVIIAFTSCIALIMVFTGISLNNKASPTTNLESFECRFSSSSQTFSIEAELELSDGMDQDEAISVAISAFKKTTASEFGPEQRMESFGSSADLGVDGLWTVKLMYSHITETWPSGHIRPTILVTSGSFEAIIDPINRTVECSAV